MIGFIEQRNIPGLAPKRDHWQKQEAHLFDWKGVLKTRKHHKDLAFTIRQISLPAHL